MPRSQNTSRINVKLIKRRGRGEEGAKERRRKEGKSKVPFKIPFVISSGRRKPTRV